MTLHFGKRAHFQYGGRQGVSHRDYKRIEAASDDESRDKLNKSNGAPEFKSRRYTENTQFLSFFACFYDHDAHRY